MALDVAWPVELILVTALLAAFLFLTPCLMSAMALDFVLAGAQALRAEDTESSSFLHFPKAVVQAFFAAVIFLLSLLISHFLTASAENARVLFVQHEQAEAPDFSWQDLVRAENSVIAALHRFRSVMLMVGRLELQDVLIFCSHFIKDTVRFLSWAAPALELSPLHFRLEELPPPASRILFRIGPKRPFFPALLPEVLLYFSILDFCIRKLDTLSFIIFMYVIAVSMQVAFIQVVALCVDFLVPFLFPFLFPFLLFFRPFFLAFLPFLPFFAFLAFLFFLLFFAFFSFLLFLAFFP